MSTSNSRDREEKECQGRNMLLFCYNKVKNTEREIMTINKGDNLRLKILRINLKLDQKEFL